jgi:hypothetical protein
MSDPKEVIVPLGISAGRPITSLTDAYLKLLRAQGPLLQPDWFREAVAKELRRREAAGGSAREKRVNPVREGGDPVQCSDSDLQEIRTTPGRHSEARSFFVAVFFRPACFFTMPPTQPAALPLRTETATPSRGGW